MAVKYSIYGLGGAVAVKPLGGVPSLRSSKDIRLGKSTDADTFTFFIKEYPFFTGLFSEFGSDASDTPFASADALITAIGGLMT